LVCNRSKKAEVAGATPVGGLLEEVNMPTDRRTMDKLKRGYRDELALLEEKCKAGNATKQEYEQLTKLRRRMK
jgi:hypothetical protein